MTQEEPPYKKENCPKCSAPVIIYDDCVGLLPDEEIDGQLATHSSLVCKLRQEINELKSSSKVF
jgi:hypothetical protein